VKISLSQRRGLALLLALIIATGLIYILKSGPSSSPNFPCGKSSGEVVAIDVSAGESGSEIAQELFDKGVTASYQSFFGVAVSDSRSGSIAPGIHQIDKGICAREALEQLLDAKRISNLISIVEGAWITEIKKSLISVGYSQAEITRAFASVTLPSGFTKLEGLLFPAQYSFDCDTGKLLKTVYMVAGRIHRTDGPAVLKYSYDGDAAGVEDQYYYKDLF
jgi:UPF0755 protein